MRKLVKSYGSASQLIRKLVKDHMMIRATVPQLVHMTLTIVSQQYNVRLYNAVCVCIILNCDLNWENSSVLMKKKEKREKKAFSLCTDRFVFLKYKKIYMLYILYMHLRLEFSAGFREALGYSTSEAPPNSSPSRLEEDGSVLNQFQ